MASSHFIVILCGGTGPRLWPLSRADNPKPFLKLLSSQSLLQNTYRRAQKIVPKDHIFFVTNQSYASRIKGQIANPKLILEPQKKNTTLAILHATAVIKNINPQAIITIFPSDHFIGNLNVFKSQIEEAVKLATEKNLIIIFGIHPASPDLSYGYFLPPHKFLEKPDLKTATKLISQGAYWNSGIYTFSVNTIESEIAHLNPEYFKLYQQLLQFKNAKNIYQASPNLPIDKVVSEKSKKITMIKAKFNWNDIGEWKSVYQQVGQNFSTLGKTKFLQIDSRKCLLSADPSKLIGLVGVNNLAIIDTPNALLICNIAQDDSFHVRDLVSQIVADPKTKNYFLKSTKK